MVKPNTQFEISVKDLELIEKALRVQLDVEISKQNEQAIKEIRNLLGRLHNQKMWYRPKNKIYISG